MSAMTMMITKPMIPPISMYNQVLSLPVNHKRTFLANDVFHRILSMFLIVLPKPEVS